MISPAERGFRATADSLLAGAASCCPVKAVGVSAAEVMAVEVKVPLNECM